MSYKASYDEGKKGNNSMCEISKRKQRIIDAAIEVLKENSIEETTVRKIAAKAGLTTGSLYHHYQNKEEIMFDVMNQSLLITAKLEESLKAGKNKDKGQPLLEEIVNEVAKRISKVEEQKLHILFLCDVIAKNKEIKEKYQSNYSNIIENTADLFGRAFEIQNDEYKKRIASILVAAMDGIALQQALEILPDGVGKMTEAFNSFFVESIPEFLKKHM